MKNNSKGHKLSINTSKIPEALSALETQESKINNVMEEIFRRAIIKAPAGDIPVIQMVVTQFNPTPAELRMLSKAFDKMATLVADRNLITTRKQAVNGWSTEFHWLYSEIGDMGRDVDREIDSIMKELETGSMIEDSEPNK